MKTTLFNLLTLILLGFCVFIVLHFVFRIFTHPDFVFTIPLAFVVTYLHQKGQDFAIMKEINSVSTLSDKAKNIAIIKEIEGGTLSYLKYAKVKTLELNIHGKCLFFMISEFAFYFGSFCFLTSEIMVQKNIDLSLSLLPVLFAGLITTYLYSRFKTAYKFNTFLL